ncbi:MAG: very short patch repair endonuclease [Gallionellaceae bacterium]
MADVLSKAQRSYCMSRIRGKDTWPELLLRKSLWAKGLRYKLKSKLPGKPDIVFPKKKIVIFVDGCFWHGCPVHSQRPATNARIWEEKLNKNIQRDQKVNGELAELGWVVLRFWEHEIKQELPAVTAKIAAVFGVAH